MSKRKAMPHLSTGFSPSKESKPQLQIVDNKHVIVSGSWRVDLLASRQTQTSLRSKFLIISHRKDIAWDLSQIEELDYIGALTLWSAWNKTLPGELKIRPEHETMFDRLATALAIPSSKTGSLPFSIKTRLESAYQEVKNHFIDMLTLTGQFVLDIGLLIKNPSKGPWKEISANIYSAGARALGITAIVGFLIGVVLSYLSAKQLQAFGGDPYLVNLLGVGITRELGPLLAAILVAGRSGSAITAQIGVMRVTEELDAMQVMGMSHGFRLVLPKTIALAIIMPLLVMWTIIFALIGGMLTAEFSIGLSVSYFFTALPEAVPFGSLMIGIGKGFIFGILIALISCHYGFRILPNTESLGHGTTNSVVAAITAVIVVDAILAVALWEVGWV
jgi:phospholipid/cholesterol/gamma-HCH transport system permease protein